MKRSCVLLLMAFSFSLFGEEFLQKEVEQALSCIQHPHRSWVEERFTAKGTPILSVAIIGGGRTGSPWHSR